MRSLAILLTFACSWLSTGAMLSANADEPAPRASFEDLGDELLMPLRDRTPLTFGTQAVKLNSDEDPGNRSATKEHRLADAVRHMQNARRSLSHADSKSAASSAQSKALEELDSMIAALNEQKRKCNGGQREKPGSKRNGTQQSSEASSSSSKAGTNAGVADAPQDNSSSDLTANLELAEELVKDLWGNLPERKRDMILQPLAEEFLPKYASEIEAYFRALASPDSEAETSR